MVSDSDPNLISFGSPIPGHKIPNCQIAMYLMLSCSCPALLHRSNSFYSLDRLSCIIWPLLRVSMSCFEVEYSSCRVLYDLVRTACCSWNIANLPSITLTCVCFLVAKRPLWDSILSTSTLVKLLAFLKMGRPLVAYWQDVWNDGLLVPEFYPLIVIVFIKALSIRFCQY
jgi:hypothetical protein